MEFELLCRAAPGAPCIYLFGEKEAPSLPNTFPAALVGIPVSDWGGDLSPWPAPRMGDMAFSGNGRAFLSRFLREIMPKAEEALGAPPSRRFAAGYSLAGLFAVYALLESGMFHGCACMSGSLWYPGWTDYLRQAPPPPPTLFYCSCGKKEGKTRRAPFSELERGIEATLAFFQSAKAECRMEWFPGGHFQDVPTRLAAGLTALADAGQR